MKTNLLIVNVLLVILANSGFAQLVQQSNDYKNNLTNIKSPLTKNNIEGNEDFNIKISPNPTTGEVKLNIVPVINLYKPTLLIKIKTTKAELYDLQGNIVFEKTDFGDELNLDIFHYAIGVYFMKICINDNLTKDVKIIKN